MQHCVHSSHHMTLEAAYTNWEKSREMRPVRCASKAWKVLAAPCSISTAGVVRARQQAGGSSSSSSLRLRATVTAHVGHASSPYLQGGIHIESKFDIEPTELVFHLEEGAHGHKLSQAQRVGAVGVKAADRKAHTSMSHHVRVNARGRHDNMM